MAYQTDNRWGPWGIAPDNARAAYGARWIDNGSSFDILGDRQGFAYDQPSERDALIELLVKHEPHTYNAIPHDDLWRDVLGVGDFHVWMRRFGGYVYVEAWLEAA